jgi:hypothetical protein
MADLQHPAAPFGECSEHFGAFQILGDRLLDQHVNTAVDQASCDLEMLRCGYGHAGRRDATVEAAVVGCRFGAEVVRYRPGPCLVDVDDRNQPGGGIGRILPCMKAPEIPCPHDGYGNRFCHFLAILSRGDVSTTPVFNKAPGTKKIVHARMLRCGIAIYHLARRQPDMIERLLKFQAGPGAVHGLRRTDCNRKATLRRGSNHEASGLFSPGRALSSS